MREIYTKKSFKNMSSRKSMKRNQTSAKPSPASFLEAQPFTRGDVGILQMQQAVGNQAMVELIQKQILDHQADPMTQQPIQRKITILETNKTYSSYYNNLDELEQLIKEHIPDQELFYKFEPTTFNQALTRIDFKNRTFKKISDLVTAVLSEVREQVRSSSSNTLDDNPNAIPKYLHHFWAGGSLSREALTNLFEWLGKANQNGWTQYIMTDSVINSNEMFEGSQLQKQLDLLREGGAVIVDMAQLPLNAGHDEKENPISEAYHLLRDKLLLQEGKSKLPYISDLARYVQLFNLGGVYADVDINPGTVDLSRSMQMPEKTGTVPFLGPGFRTMDDARHKGLFDAEPGKREAALLGSFLNEYAIGNHFIGTKARNPLIKAIADTTSSNILSSGVSNGGIDVLKAFASMKMDLGQSVAQSIPPWLMDVSWVTEESNSIVD